jgi:hypothetical protein
MAILCLTPAQRAGHFAQSAFGLRGDSDNGSNVVPPTGLDIRAIPGGMPGAVIPGQGLTLDSLKIGRILKIEIYRVKYNV